MIRFMRYNADEGLWLTHHEIQRDAVLRLDLSTVRTSSESYFMLEPRTLRFTCVRDEWLYEHFVEQRESLGGNLSPYQIQLLSSEGEIRFTGFPDLTRLKFDAVRQTFQFETVDHLALLNRYSDLKSVYALSSGYTPGQVFQGFLTAISNRIGIPLNGVTSVPAHSLPVSEGDPLVLHTEETNQLLQDPDPPPHVTTSITVHWNINSSDMWFQGVKNTGGHRNKAVFYLRRTWQASEIITGTGNFTGVRRQLEQVACVLVNFAGLGSDRREMQVQSQWVDSIDNVNAAWETISDKVDQQLTQMGTGSFSDYAQQTQDISGNLWQMHDAGGGAYQVWFSGNAIIPRIYPGDGYLAYDFGEDRAERFLDVLKAVLLIWNLTITPLPQGGLLLRGRNGSGSATVIETDDLLSMETGMEPVEVAPVQRVDVLAGDQTVLKDCLAGYFRTWLENRQTVTCRVFNGASNSKYNLSLFDDVLAGSLTSRVIEVGLDEENHVLRFKGWRI